MTDSTQRFSDRVEDYIGFRPHYPAGMIELLCRKLGLTKAWVVADIGSGTGISSLPFLENGNTVFGVEPNREMREAAEQLLKSKTNFISIAGTAENTLLKDKSIDLIFCGQAYHWFDPVQAKQEFQRILKENGHIVLAWNQRKEETPFLKRYEQVLCNTIKAYKNVRHKNLDATELAGFFSPAGMQTASLPNFQEFDLAGLKGRLLSSSYCPKSGSEYERLMQSMEDLYTEFQQNGKVRFDYSTNLYWC